MAALQSCPRFGPPCSTGCPQLLCKDGSDRLGRLEISAQDATEDLAVSSLTEGLAGLARRTKTCSLSRGAPNPACWVGYSRSVASRAAMGDQPPGLNAAHMGGPARRRGSS